MAVPLVVALVAGACAPLAGKEIPGAVKGDQVTIVNFAFDPETLEVAEGTVVRWLNVDDRPHSVTSGVPGNPDGTFDKATDGSDRRFQFTFGAKGIVLYYCRFHPSMRGTVVVR